MADRYMKDSDWASFKNFKKSEFKCKCKGKYCNGYPHLIAYSLVELSQRLRTHYGKSVTITSGLRCKEHNKNVGGTANSKHQLGQSADIYFKGMDKKEVIKWLKKQPEYSYAYTNETNMKNAVHITTKLTQVPKVEEKKEEPKEESKVDYENSIKSYENEISNLKAQISKLEADNINLRNKVKILNVEPKLIYCATRNTIVKFKIKKDEKMLIY